MQDSKFGNLNAMVQYKEWNLEMKDLYKKYSFVPELNHALMEECPVYAMYALAEFLKRKQVETEDDLKSVIDEIYIKAGRDPIMFAQAHIEAERAMYSTLKPIIEDYMAARMYFVMAMNKSREEYLEYLSQRDERYQSKTK